MKNMREIKDVRGDRDIKNVPDKKRLVKEARRDCRRLLKVIDYTDEEATVASAEDAGERKRFELQRGREQAKRGGLTFEMEYFLRKRGESIEVRPQKWKRIEAF